MILKADFRLVKVVSKIFGNIAMVFACLAHLGHTPEIEMILFVSFCPTKPRRVGFSKSHPNIANVSPMFIIFIEAYISIYS
jgi:hypothetical protein